MSIPKYQTLRHAAGNEAHHERGQYDIVFLKQFLSFRLRGTMVDMALDIHVGLRLDFQLPLIEKSGWSHDKGSLD